MAATCSFDTFSLSPKLHCRWRQPVLSKRFSLSTKLYGVTFKTTILSALFWRQTCSAVEVLPHYVNTSNTFSPVTLYTLTCIHKNIATYCRSYIKNCSKYEKIPGRTQLCIQHIHRICIQVNVLSSKPKGKSCIPVQTYSKCDRVAWRVLPNEKCQRFVNC